jgi:hypothetical protein
MTRNQLHGKKFEDLIKGCGLFPGASDQSRSITAGVDIEARFDREMGLPTSIKTSGSRTITLSDARRFWAIDYQFRMLVGIYEQIDRQKHFGVVHEFLLTPDNLLELRGAVAAVEVERLHYGIGLIGFPAGQHAEARAWIARELANLPLDQSRIVLNPKIDSKEQRRLQCSVSLGDLISVTQADGNHVVHTDHIGSLLLPIRLLSGRREFVR